MTKDLSTIASEFLSAGLCHPEPNLGIRVAHFAGTPLPATEAPELCHIWCFDFSQSPKPSSPLYSLSAPLCFLVEALLGTGLCSLESYSSHGEISSHPFHRRRESEPRFVLLFPLSDFRSVLCFRSVLFSFPLRISSASPCPYLLVDESRIVVEPAEG